MKKILIFTAGFTAGLLFANIRRKIRILSAKKRLKKQLIKRMEKYRGRAEAWPWGGGE